MKELDLSYNELDDDKVLILSNCLHKIEKLTVGRCNLTKLGFERICNAIKNLSVPVNIQGV